MKPVQASRVLSATPEAVFAVLSDPTVKADVVPCVVSAEILGEAVRGPGLRFSETHRMGKREMTMNFEVTEWTEPSHLRIQCLQHGTLWDSSFDMAEHPGGAELVITMDARAKSVLPRLLNPLMKPLFRRGLTEHLDALEAHFRRGADA
jgi:carbon monoxide dehydrogenase subunit G